MAQNLDSIIQELDAAYNPSRQAINERINGLQGAQDADIAGLQAQQTQSFNDITDGARSRGIGFSGIPLQEQAKYTAGTFLPAAAKVKQQYAANRGSLVDALNGMNQDQYKTAMSIRETQADRDFQAEQARLSREAAAAAARASDTSGSALASLFGGGQQQQAVQKPQTDPIQQAAYNDVATRIQGNPASIKSDYQATLASANRGNQKDKVKIQLYHQLRPDLFGAGVSAGALANGNQLRF